MKTPAEKQEKRGIGCCVFVCVSLYYPLPSLMEASSLRSVECFDIDDASIRDGRVQKDRLKELRLWSHSVQRAKEKAKFAIVAANNHYAGFGPATANSFRKMVGLKEAV